mmetsp:Transcript_14702/g.43561  ORF Transcript_14702/g.43561 Transcript_14702/m.43561 type:complete len:168 (-) Transcript_14702:385-888(-)
MRQFLRLQLVRIGQFTLPHDGQVQDPAGVAVTALGPGGDNRMADGSLEAWHRLHEERMGQLMFEQDVHTQEPGGCSFPPREPAPGAPPGRGCAGQEAPVEPGSAPQVLPPAPFVSPAPPVIAESTWERGRPQVLRLQWVLVGQFTFKHTEHVQFPAGGWDVEEAGAG